MNRSTGDVASPNSTDALETVRWYHQVTKHHVYRPAHGPGYLDWDAQPDPFRRYDGASQIGLDKVPPTEEPHYDDAFVEGRNPPVPLNRHSISQLFFDSLAISAWKSDGGARWALRVNPSSGNLHPTEGYLLCGPVDDLCAVPVVCHYAPKEHALEVRAQVGVALWEALCERCPLETVFVGLTSVQGAHRGGCQAANAGGRRGSTGSAPIATANMTSVTPSPQSPSPPRRWDGKRD